MVCSADASGGYRNNDATAATRPTSAQPTIYEHTVIDASGKTAQHQELAKIEGQLASYAERVHEEQEQGTENAS